MPLHIDVWSDFVCPYCYAVAFSLKKLQENFDVELHWRSFELRPDGSPPMDPAYLEYIETQSRPYFNGMMRDQHGLDIKEGPFGISSRLALRMDKAVEGLFGHDLGIQFHDAVTRAYWLETKDISDENVLMDVARAVGVPDLERLADALDDPAYDQQVTTDVMQAHAYGLSGVPAVVFENKYLISGAQPYTQFEQTARRVLAEQQNA